jgi:hypothetical protein
LFTDNDTNVQRLYQQPNARPWVKDGINDYVVGGRSDAVNPERAGTKAAARYRATLAAGQSVVARLRLTNSPIPGSPFGGEFDTLFGRRVREADEFYETVIPAKLSDDGRSVMRQAFAGLLWSKQFYHYDVARWLAGDPTAPAVSIERMRGRNHEWRHLYNDDVISMPDKWEYPWYAAWDLAFHTIPLALIDPEFTKAQLILFLREWYMHPNGQIPAYEWALGDVNPPVHAWAALRVYRIERRLRGRGDREFLERIFHKLLLNFTWWVNRKDAGGKNVFQGGFLGLDNIGVFDRSAPLPTGGHIEQSDGTSWMAMYCLNMLAIALELAPAGSGLPGRRLEVLRALRVHRARGARPRRRRDQSVGRAGRLLLRRAPRQRRGASVEGALDGRADPALRGGDARAGGGRPSAGVQAADAVVHRQPSRAAPARRGRGKARRRRAPAAGDRRARAAPARAEVHAGRAGVPVAARGARGVALPQGSSVRATP